MIYMFGDLRQLRSFELARPSISGPRPIARARPRLRSLFTLTREEPQEPPEPLPQPKDTLTWSVASPTSTGTPVVCLASYSFRVGEHTATTDSDATNPAAARAHEEDDFGIEISPAYYHDPAPDPADAKSLRRESVRSGESRLGVVIKWVLGRRTSTGTGTGVIDEKAGSHHADTGDGSVAALADAEDDQPTAAFIAHEYPAPTPTPEPEPAPVQFDFDKLPAVPGMYAHPGACLPMPPPPPPAVVMPRAKEREREREKEKARQWWDTCPRHPAVEATLAPRVRVRVRGTWRTRLRRVMWVPVLGPLTRVLEPVVARGQWDIVVRSTVVAALGAWIFVGCLVALPVRA